MSLSRFRLPQKDQLAMKLIDYPLLNSILRMVLYERLFRFALVGLILMGIAIALFLGRFWTATPKEFSPVVKLRGLDYVQAWSLRRTALKKAYMERYDEALYCWRVAVQNNPGDPDLLRGCLKSLLPISDKRKMAPVLIGHSRWLMRLTHTNQADLELSVKLYQLYGLDDLTISMLVPLEKQLTPFLDQCYLKAIFNRGQYTQFAERWQEARLRGVNLNEPELVLYRAAYDAGWGLLSDAGPARKVLDAAKEDPARRLLAHRLELQVSERLVQPEVYRKSLDQLQDWRQDRLQDHIGYWQLLNAVGRKSDALKLIDEHVVPPTSGEETVLLAKAHFDLGQKDKSREILERYAPEYADSEAVWVTYTNLLTEQKRWDELVKVALLIRHEDNPLRDVLAGYSYYIEGVGELGRGRRPTAIEAFKRIPATKVKNKIWELILAEKLEALGFPEISKDVLLNVQKEVPDQPDYWLLLAKTAFDLKDPDLLVSAMAGAYKLKPDDILIMHNYAAALISTRRRPEEALKLTSLEMAKVPDKPEIVVNHVLALLQNKRLDDGESVLQGLDPAKLSGPTLTSYYFALFELRLDQQRFEEARQAGDRIEDQYLLPTERQWIKSARKQMEPSAQNKA